MTYFPIPRDVPRRTQERLAETEPQAIERLIADETGGELLTPVVDVVYVDSPQQDNRIVEWKP
ncbi:hypothetical protein [Actinoplanes sp. URMC 104]|uniref:hypothetical protein n=1 Tax=Actinoplanes sp. URMC 104 TaxID=3423409 RepID=UPI003F1E29DC